MLRILPGFVSALVVGGLLGLPQAIQAQEEDKKDPPAKKEREKEKKRPAPDRDFEFPDFDELFKGVPLDPKQAKELREQLNRAREQWRQAIERYRAEMRKGRAPFPEGFPMPVPGGPFPGGFPGPFPGPRPFERPAEGRLGVMIEVPSEILTEQLGLKEEQGLVVLQVRPDSPAAKAGIKPNDILLEWDGKPVSSDPRAFKERVDAAKEPVTVKVLRRGKTETLKDVTLPERRVDPARPRPRIDVRAPRIETPGRGIALVDVPRG